MPTSSEHIPLLMSSVPAAIFGLSAIATVTMAVLFSALARSLPRTIQGTHQWEGGILLFALSFFLFSLGDLVNIVIGLIVAQTATIFGFMLVNAGLRRFFGAGTAHKRSTILVFLLVYFSTILWFSVIDKNQAVLTLIFATGSAIVILDTLIVLVRNMHQGSGALIVIAAFTLPLATRILRIVNILKGGEVPLNMLEPTLTQLTFLAAPMLAVPVGTVGLLWLISQRLIREIKELNRHDELTGCLKKNVFKDELSREIIRTARTQSPMCVMMIDLDDFKQINDKLGHQRGDEVLSYAANLIKLATRNTDFVGRYGGDEFCIALPETDTTAAMTVANRILKLSQGTEAKSFGISFSIGTAALQSPSETPDSLLTRADQALYSAKSAGKSKVVIQPSVQSEITQLS
jgi:diguanylate cyclase (GGDEF)-like protein